MKSYEIVNSKTYKLTDEDIKRIVIDLEHYLITENDEAIQRMLQLIVHQDRQLAIKLKGYLEILNLKLNNSNE